MIHFNIQTGYQFGMNPPMNEDIYITFIVVCGTLQICLRQYSMLNTTRISQLPPSQLSVSSNVDIVKIGFA